MDFRRFIPKAIVCTRHGSEQPTALIQAAKDALRHLHWATRSERLALEWRLIAMPSDQASFVIVMRELPRSLA